MPKGYTPWIGTSATSPSVMFRSVIKAGPGKGSAAGRPAHRCKTGASELEGVLLPGCLWIPTSKLPALKRRKVLNCKHQSLFCLVCHSQEAVVCSWCPKANFFVLSRRKTLSAACSRSIRCSVPDQQLIPARANTLSCACLPVDAPPESLLAHLQFQPSPKHILCLPLQCWL